MHDWLICRIHQTDPEIRDHHTRPRVKVPHTSANFSILNFHRAHEPAALDLGDHDLVNRVCRRRTSGRSKRTHNWCERRAAPAVHGQPAGIARSKKSCDRRRCRPGECRRSVVRRPTRDQGRGCCFGAGAERRWYYSCGCGHVDRRCRGGRRWRRMRIARVIEKMHIGQPEKAQCQYTKHNGVGDLQRTAHDFRLLVSGL